MPADLQACHTALVGGYVVEGHVPADLIVGPLYYPAHRDEGLRPHRVGELWLIMGDHPDHFVDITGTFARKVAAVRAHASQWGRHPDLEAFLRERAQRIGAARGLPLAEAFRRLVPG